MANQRIGHHSQGELAQIRDHPIVLVAKRSEPVVVCCFDLWTLCVTLVSVDFYFLKFAVPICFHFNVADPFEIGCEVSANLSMSLFLHSDAGPKLCSDASFNSRQVIIIGCLCQLYGIRCKRVWAQYDRPFFLCCLKIQIPHRFL